MNRGKETKANPYKSFLNDVPSSNVFWCHDGTVLKNIAELANALKVMPADTYNYHVNNEKNDFRNWIRDVIGDTTLANQLVKGVNQQSALSRVESRLRFIKAL